MSDKLINKITDSGIDLMEVDLLIHDVMSCQASVINNSGLNEQIKFLRGRGWTDEQVLNYLNLQ